MRKTLEVKVTANLMKLEDLTFLEKCVLAIIRSFAKTDKGFYASNTYLADALTVSPRQVQRFIQKLKENHYIQVKLDNASGRNSNRNIYVTSKTPGIPKNYNYVPVLPTIKEPELLLRKVQ